MTYECIKDFCVDLVYGNGFTEKQGVVNIKKGSMWKDDTEATNMMNTEVHLQELTGMSWLELSKDRLASHFRQID